MNLATTRTYDQLVDRYKLDAYRKAFDLAIEIVDVLTEIAARKTEDPVLLAKILNCPVHMEKLKAVCEIMNNSSSWESRFEASRKASHLINRDFFRALNDLYQKDKFSDVDHINIANDSGPEKLAQIERVAGRVE